MFSLVISLISIALVAALALATIYYGAQSLQQGGTNARATSALSQAHQVMGAADVFGADFSRWPTGIGELVSKDYLKSAPFLFTEQVPLDAAGNRVWTEVGPGLPQYWARAAASEAVCQKVNLMARGDNGIYAQAVDAFGIQCFGPSEPYTLVVQKTASPGVPRLSVTIPSANAGLTAVTQADLATLVVSPTVFATGTGGSGGSTTPPPVIVGPGAPTGGGTPLASISVSTLFFLNQAVNTATQSVLITNVGSGTLSVLAQALGTGYSAQTSGCASVPAGQSCTLNVTYTPPGQSAYDGGQVTLSSNASSSPIVYMQGSTAPTLCFNGETYGTWYKRAGAAENDPRRSTPEAACQDYVDYMNALSTTSSYSFVSFSYVPAYGANMCVMALTSPGGNFVSYGSLGSGTGCR